jgi:hypothetical protein
MEIFFELPGAVPSVVEIDADDLVERLKEKIAEKGKIPPNHQRLIFEGRILKEGHLVSEYGVSMGSIIQVTPRLRRMAPFLGHLPE